MKKSVFFTSGAGDMVTMKSSHSCKDPFSTALRNSRNCCNAEGLIGVHVKIKETDLLIQADRNVQRRAKELVLRARCRLEEYIVRYPAFYTSLQPIPKDFTAPSLIQKMFDAGRKANVGPMAAVAGGIAEYVGSALIDEGVVEIIVENGGDIFLQRKVPAVISIFAGESPLSNRVGMEIPPVGMPWGVCSCSGTIDHGISMGQAYSVTVAAQSTYLADAAATRLGNEVGERYGQKESVDRALEIGREMEGITGVAIICGEILGAVGDVKLVELEQEEVS
ncbi:MAG: UPF0280 family protein [Desulfopila sp.]